MSKPDPGTLPVFLSYPKSGRSWIRYLLELAGIRMHFSHAGTGSRRHALGRPFRSVDPQKYAGRRIVFMHRNPIDTTVSFYFQMRKRELIPWTWRYIRRYPRYLLAGRWPPAALEKFVMHPGYGVEKVCRFNRAWLDHLTGRPETLILSYEDMTADGERVFAEILRFLGGNPAEAKKLLEQGRFSEMQQVETKEVQRPWLMTGIPGDPESMKVRRGKVRGYTDYLNAETIARCREIAARYGFDA